MVTLHGRHLRAGITLSPNRIGKELPKGNNFIPFPPFTSINLNLPSGLSQIFQIGIVPLVGLIEYNIPPTEVTFNFLLAPDYPYYQQLFYFLQKDADTFHFPTADIRIGAATIPGFNVTPVINLWNCVARRAQISISERFATLNMTFIVPYGIYFTADSSLLPPTFIPETSPIRKFELSCNIYSDLEGMEGLGAAALTVTSVEMEYSASVSYSLTLPNLLHAFFGRETPYEPMPISAPFTAREGSISFSGSLRVALPPTEAVEFPQHITGARRWNIQLSTPIGTFLLRKAKLLSFSPALNITSPVEWNLQFNALGLFYAPP